MKNQAYLFLIFVLNGFLIGILFDIFRILRKAFKSKDFVTYIQDILYWVITGFTILYSVFKFNNGELRSFVFIGIFAGFLIHYLLFSSIFIRISIYIINFIKQIFHFSIIVPFKLISNITKKLFFKPISFIIINFKKTLSNFKIKIKKLHNNNKKMKCKKDLA